MTLDSGGNIALEPAAGSHIKLDDVIQVDSGVITGATSVTSTAFVGALTGDITGNASGTALTVTQAAQTAITSVGTLTALQVDNINLNGSAITATTAADLVINCADGQSVVVEGLDIDDGVVTGASSITSTAFLGTLDGVVGGNTAAAGTFTTCDATTDFTIGATVITNGVLTCLLYTSDAADE